MKAIEVTRLVTLGEEEKKALTHEMSAEDYIEALLIRQLHPDALQFIAHSLPKRQAVWWALGCVKQAIPPELPPEQDAAVKVTERWRYQASNRVLPMLVTIVDGKIVSIERTE